MRRATSAIRTLTRRAGLSLATFAGHTVRIANRVASALPGFAGATLVSWGASMIYEPAGWIVGGAFLLWIGHDFNARATPPGGD